MLHGQILSYSAGEGKEGIDLSGLRNKGIRYLALGHIHSYQEGQLPPDGVWCYPGCLEGRGFDECGTHGFVLLDIDEETLACRRTFIPFAMRTVYEVQVGISGCINTVQIAARAKEALKEAGCREKDMVKLVLTGETDISCEKNAEQLTGLFAQAYYAVRVEDRSRLAVDYRQFVHDASLKGEFVRLLQEDGQLQEEEKAEIIRCGISALQGEELES